MIHLFDEDKLKALAYYRHSAEDKQENSVENQKEQVENFADKEHIQILEHFRDEGISGLTANRPGFQEMFSKWVTNPDSPKVDYILVYDASRFGRFQKMSEVWRLLGLCEERGIRLASVTRGLPRDETTVMDSFIITLDFGMSGEFSKLLSDKVSYGSTKIAQQGFSAGGCAPYGYVRVLLDEQRQRKGILEPGQHKEISNQRVTFEPATNGEAEIVNRIFHEFVNLNRYADEIANSLNEDGVPTAKDRQWNSSGIIKILTNETYMGTRVYNKTWGRLKQKKRAVPSEQWVRCPDAHEALVDADTFHKAQERLFWMRPRARNRSTSQMRSVKEYVWKFIDETSVKLTDDQKLYVKRSLPVVFGASYSVNGYQHSCFYIPNEYQRYDKLIACEVSLRSDGAELDKLYKINIDDLGWTNYKIVRAEDELPTLSFDEFRAAISELASKVVISNAPWLMSKTTA
ncbi:MAG TPA: recombinase family protein [Candidatus Saccharimonadales bacterium]|nr:recombinase family protein [Candidatus Saccharimonadales bacterium]